MPNLLGCSCYWDTDFGVWQCVQPRCNFTTRDDTEAREHGMTGMELILDHLRAED